MKKKLKLFLVKIQKIKWLRFPKKKRNKIFFALFFVFLFILLFSGRSGSEKEIFKVRKGSISKEIFESGEIKKGDSITLSFSMSGLLGKISIKEGDTVKKGDIIASLDNEKLKINLLKANSALRSAEIEFNRFLSGGPERDLELAKDSLEKAEFLWISSLEDLNNTKNSAEERVNNAYRDYFSVLSKSILAAEDIYELVSLVYNDKFSTLRTKETNKVLGSRDRIEEIVNEIKDLKLKINDYNDQENIDLALSETEKKLKEISDNLDIVIGVLEDPVYKEGSREEVSLVKVEKNNINQLIFSVTSTINSISLAKSISNSEISLAESQEASLNVAFNESKNIFNKLTDPDKDELELFQIKLNQAQYEVASLEKMLQDSIIRSPFDGKVLSIYHKEKENIQPGQPLALIVPDEPYHVEVNIYEGYISDLNIGSSVEIELVSFPNQKFSGEVGFIGPGAISIDGVVYYKVHIYVDDLPKNVMVGMTSDVTITLEEKHGVLFVPENSIEREDSSVLKVIDRKRYKETKVVLGLRGSDRMVEVISGLNEGDKVLILR
jgi:RND family efflux transporter MFP subunit